MSGGGGGSEAVGRAIVWAKVFYFNYVIFINILKRNNVFRTVFLLYIKDYQIILYAITIAPLHST